MYYPQTVSLTVSSGTIALGTTVIWAAQVPTDALGGGARVVDAWVSSNVAISTGSIPVVRVVYGNSGGTLLGTVGANTAAYTAGTANAITVTDTFIDAEYYIGFKFEGTAVAANLSVITAGFHLLPGY